MTVLGYSTQRVWLHWLSAVVIIWTLASGFDVVIAMCRKARSGDAK